MSGYDDVIEAVIEREKEVVGKEAAVEEAREVNGLNVDEDGGVVSFRDGGKEILAALVERYVDLYGSVAAILIVRDLEDMDLSGIELPEVLAKELES